MHKKLTRSVIHVSSLFGTAQNLENQSSHLFPFLDSKLMQQQSKSRFTFDNIQAECSLSNIKSYLQTIDKETSRKEFVFFGRSNVGKSTLLNSLIQNYVAITSKKPGKTKKLLFVKMNTNKQTFLVDCPGYGYASSASKTEINQWGKLIELYLKFNPANMNILCLLDVSHGLKQTDAMLFNLLKNYKKKFTVIFTKCDQMDQKNYENAIKIAQQLQEEYDSYMDYYVHFTSARMGRGIDQLRSHLMFLHIREQFK